jgi:hypothetical protein
LTAGSTALSEKAIELLDAFNPYLNGWIFTANGTCQIESHHFRDWVLPWVIRKTKPEEILAAFEAEVQRNASIYVEVSPIFGVKIDRECRLAEGVKLVPEGLHGWWWEGPDAPRGTCFLCQSFQVKPAFEVRAIDGTSPRTEGIAKPDSKTRETVRHRIRLACLLASPGAVELPISLFKADEDSLFITPNHRVVRPVAALPLVSFPADEALVKTAFDHLVQFQHPDNLARAIDRLGRARLASSPVDRALELGIAAEIALMHGENASKKSLTRSAVAPRGCWGMSPRNGPTSLPK